MTASVTEKPDFTGLRATYINCTLNRSPDRSHTKGVINRSVVIMDANGVGVDQTYNLLHLATMIRRRRDPGLRQPAHGLGRRLPPRQRQPGVPLTRRDSRLRGGRQMIVVTDNRSAHRFEARNSETLAGFAQYARTSELLAFVHTEVDPAFVRRGVGSSPAREGIASAQAEGL